MKRALQEAAKAGRYGDNTLIHVSKAEVQGLEALLGLTNLPTNPETGLKEAFFFLPFLLGAAGAAAAPVAAAAAPIAAGAATAGLGAAAAGLGAATTGLAGAGLGAATALPAAATALPAATAGLGAAGAGLGAAGAGELGALGAAGPAGLAGASGAANAAPLIVGTSSAGAAAPLASTPAALGGAAAPAITMPAVATPQVAGLGGVAPMASHPAAAAVAAPKAAALGLPATAPIPTASPLGGAAAATAAPAKAGGLGGMFGGLNSNSLMQGLGMMALMKGQMGGGGKESDGKKKDVSGNNYHGGDTAFPDKDYQGGIDPEFDYFPNEHYYAGGGLVKGYAMGGLASLPAPGSFSSQFASRYGSTPMPFGGGGSNPLVTGPRSAPIVPPQAMAHQAVSPAAYATQGLGQFAHPQGGQMMGRPTAMPMQANPSFARNAPTMPMQGMNVGHGNQMSYAGPAMASHGNRFAAGGPVKGPPSGKDQKLIQKTIQALQGMVPNPEPVIADFVKTFGQQALQDLITRLDGGTKAAAAAQQQQTSGLGALDDGMSDSVPASIDGQQPAALSQGEFVMPADVVSHLGNGSTDAGASQLQGMVDRTRQARGAPAPQQIDPRSVMPA